MEQIGGGLSKWILCVKTAGVGVGHAPASFLSGNQDTPDLFLFLKNMSKPISSYFVWYADQIKTWCYITLLDLGFCKLGNNGKYPSAPSVW